MASNASDPIIVIDNVYASYGPVKAVNGISFSVPRGACFAILGPNGAGKTTLLSCLEGIKKIDRGNIFIDGESITQATDRIKYRLGVQLQQAALFPDLKVAELVRFYSAFYRIFPSRHDVLKLLDRFNLVDKAGAFAHQLSGGQRQRLSLALALVHDPSILLLDEPTTGLDPQARHYVWEVIRELRNEGKTVLLTTHYMEEAEVLSQHVGIVDHGQIVALDRPQALIQNLGSSATVQARISLSEDVLQLLRNHELVTSLSYNDPNLVLQTTAPQQALALLQTIVGASTGVLEEIVIRRPTLEDVFLTLTGHALRDGSAS